jgi:hypothetical protein
LLYKTENRFVSPSSKKFPENKTSNLLLPQVQQYLLSGKDSKNLPFYQDFSNTDSTFHCNADSGNWFGALETYSDKTAPQVMAIFDLP